MSRPLRFEFDGALYHITARGNARQAIFEDDVDRQRFLDLLASIVTRFGWRVHAYCLMGNHYHLVVETPECGLSEGMRQLNGVHAQRFNRRHGRVGHVFQGRFKSILVDREAYLLQLARYVVLNPVRAGLVAAPDDWRWSSYRATVGLEAAPSWLTVSWLLSQFGRTSSDSAERFAEFVRERGDTQIWRALRGGILLGDDAVPERVLAEWRTAVLSPEVPRRERFAARPPLSAVLPSPSTCTAASIVTAYRDHRYTLAEIASRVGVHYATVSRIVNRGAWSLRRSRAPGASGIPQH